MGPCAYDYYIITQNNLDGFVVLENRSSVIQSNPLQPSTSIFRSFPSSSRRFSHSPFLFSTNATPSSTASPQSLPPKSIPPSKNADPEPKQSLLQSAGRSLAAAVRKRAPLTTETYIAYGACNGLVKECARQADYTIPQALDKMGVIPKTKAGEDLGVGSGPWYEGDDLIPPKQKLKLSLIFPNFRPRPHPDLQHLGPSHLSTHVRAGSTHAGLPRHTRLNLEPAPP